ncbi:MAG: bifunctional DNA primase/polymerase [Peptococcaceae bacterium]|nr:bifunctional DNA primase/polymerase [Peptococcaceae bacterium]
MALFDTALFYLTCGFSVIPLQPRGKRPLLSSWSEYQSRRAMEEEIHDWFSRWPGMNIGIVTGQVSGLIVLDLDGPEAVEAVRGKGGLPPTPCAVTGKGYHYYLVHPGQPVQNAAALGGVKGLDVRADGGYVVAPPSIHPSSRQYRWAKGRSPDDLPLAPCPAWLLDMLANRGRAQAACSAQEPGWVEALLRGVPEGQRDDACTRLAGHFFGKGLPESEVLALLLAWNQRNQPPMKEREVEKCVRSVASRETRNPARPRAHVQPVFRLDGPVYTPPGWHTLVICRDWAEARKLAAQGNAVAVCRKDGSLPPEAAQLVATASDIKTAGFSSEEARRLAWELYPLRLVRAATEGTAALKPEPEPAPDPQPEPEPEPSPAPQEAAPAPPPGDHARDPAACPGTGTCWWCDLYPWPGGCGPRVQARR